MPAALTDEEWEDRLSEDVFAVCRRKATEIVSFNLGYGQGVQEEGQEGGRSRGLHFSWPYILCLVDLE